MSKEYTPTTDLMRQWHVLADHTGNKSTEEYEAEFVRWLATVETAAEQRGKEQGWDEALELLENNSEIDLDDLEHYKEVCPYRADQMEGDDAV